MLRMVPVDRFLLRTWNGKYLHFPKVPIMDSLLSKLADELLVQDITQPSAVLGSLSDHGLQAFCDSVMQDFALALLIGTDQDSSWRDGKLVIDANLGPIHLLQAAFYTVKLECHRRYQLTANASTAWVGGQAQCLVLPIE